MSELSVSKGMRDIGVSLEGLCNPSLGASFAPDTVIWSSGARLSLRV